MKKLLEKNDEIIKNCDLIKKIEKDIEKINKENKIVKEEYNNKFLNQSNEMNKSNKNIELINEEIKELNNKIIIIKREIADNKSMIKERKAIINNIKDTIDSLIYIENKNNDNLEDKRNNSTNIDNDNRNNNINNNTINNIIVEKKNDSNEFKTVIDVNNMIDNNNNTININNINNNNMIGNNTINNNIRIANNMIDNNKINNNNRIDNYTINDNKIDINKINDNNNIDNNKTNELNISSISNISNVSNTSQNVSEQKEIKNNNVLSKEYQEYIDKINYEFKNDPRDLKYNSDITNNNTYLGWNDMFEIFISYINNKEYLVSPHKQNYNLEIFLLYNNKKVTSLKGHKKDVRTIRYFINQKNNNEYLISADDNRIVIIWDITNKYSIKYQIDTQYGGMIFSCLMMFPNGINDNYIITSTNKKSDDIDKSATKIYSLNNGQYSKYIKNSNNNYVYYLLSWFNKQNNKYYIIQFANKKVILSNLVEEEIFELKQGLEDDHYSGFIYTIEKTDYLCSSSSNGYINIWDLFDKKIYQTINTNGCVLAHTIQWNNKYILVADYDNKSFKIIDIDKGKIVGDINKQHTKEVKCIKKVNHPKFGESVLSVGRDNTIKLWTIKS